MWLIDQLYTKLVLSFEYKGLPPWHRNTWDARSWLLAKLMSTCLQQLSQGLIELQLKKEMLFSGEKTTYVSYNIILCLIFYLKQE